MTKRLLYSEIYDYLTGKITSNELLPYQQLPTEIELARQFNVSRITSRRALIEMEKDGWILRSRGKGSSVKPRNPEPVYIDALGGVKNVVAMVIPHQDENQRLMDYVLGAADQLASRGFSLCIHTYKGKPDRERELLATLPASGVRGIIYYPVNVNAHLELLNTLHMNDYPIVTIDKYFDLSVSHVVSDNFNGAYQVASHLIGLGHSRIAFVSRHSLESASTIKNRFCGYCEALKDNGLDIDSDIVDINFKERFAEFAQRADFYKDMAERLLRQEVTAIQVVNDASAVHIIKACVEMGVNVPGQLSIAGFDDIEISRHLDIPLTTVAQDFRGIGRRAADIIVRCVEQGSRVQEQAVLPVELIVRSSSGTAKIHHNIAEAMG